MVQTEVEICNMALSRLGETNITSLTDTTKEAQQCELFFDQTRDEVLRDYDWNFAMGRVEVSPLSGDTFSPFEYKYQLPNDCLKVICPIDIASESYQDLREDFLVEGRMLLTNLTPCAIRYTKKITNPTYYDSLFVECLALKLASKIAFNLTGDRNTEINMLNQYLAQLPEAKAIDGGESRNRKKKKKYWDEYRSR